MSESLLPVISALIGAALGGIIGFLGSYLIQRRIWKRETSLEIVKTVYEPLFRQLTRILDVVKKFEKLGSLEEFEEIETNPLYYDVPVKIQVNLSQLAERLKTYEQLYGAAQGLANRIIRETMTEHGLLEERGADPRIYYRVIFDSHFVTVVTLEQGLLKGKTPRELAKSETKDLKNVELEITVSGYTAKEPKVVDKVCEIALAKAQNEPTMQQFRSQHKSLIERLNQVLDTIRSESNKIKEV